MPRATELAHTLVGSAVQLGDWVVDATVGNGHDTAFLAQCVGPSGRVFGFDVQSAALDAARERLQGQSNVTLIHRGHEHLAAGLPPDASGKIAAVMFNLGYLPGGDKGIVTRAASTLAALRQAVTLLSPGGVITVVIYTGHPGGADEAAAIHMFAHGLGAPFEVTRHVQSETLTPAPELVIIQRST
jgi:ubiquinone/menaquinone biosynthesis C-methylase UbiE